MFKVPERDIKNMELVSFLVGLLTLTLAHARKPDSAVLLSNVKSLTFREGKLTTARRVDPIPQVSDSTSSSIRPSG